MTEVRSFDCTPYRDAEEDLQRVLWATAYALLAPQDVFHLVLTTWIGKSRVLERAIKHAERQDLPVRVVIPNTHKPAVFVPKRDASTQCPLGARNYRSENFQDQQFWLFRGELYREGDAGLCQFCEHQLRCAVEGQPLDAFKNANPRSVSKPARKAVRQPAEP